MGCSFARQEVCCYRLLGGLKAAAQGGVMGVCSQTGFKGSSCLHDNQTCEVCVSRITSGMCRTRSAATACWEVCRPVRRPGLRGSAASPALKAAAACMTTTFGMLGVTRWRVVVCTATSLEYR